MCWWKRTSEQQQTMREQLRKVRVHLRTCVRVLDFSVYTLWRTGLLCVRTQCCFRYKSEKILLCAHKDWTNDKVIKFIQEVDMRPVLWTLQTRITNNKKHDANKDLSEEFSHDWLWGSTFKSSKTYSVYSSGLLNTGLTQQLGFAALLFFGKVHSTTQAASQSTTSSCPSILATYYITEGTLCLPFVRAYFTTSAALFAYKSCALLACGYVINKGCSSCTRTDKVLHKKCVTIVHNTPFGGTAP